MEDKEIKKHTFRIGYLNSLAQFKEMTSSAAIALTEKFLNGEEIINPMNPKLDIVKEEIKKAAEMVQQNDPNYVDLSDPRDIPASKLGEIVSKSKEIDPRNQMVS